jgi:uncharacterized protein (DUF1810 family)
MRSPPPEDPFDLQRFVLAQQDVYSQALAEVASGRKQTHWMWFVFPQVAGLGFSPMARRYAIANLDEARAYLAHPLLGSRLLACADAALAVDGRTAHDVFGSPDDRKLRSCATLFAHVSPPGSAFHRLLEKYFDGIPDSETMRVIAAESERS